MSTSALVAGTVILAITFLGFLLTYVANHQHGFRNVIIGVFGIVVVVCIGMVQKRTHVINETMAFLTNTVTATAEPTDDRRAYSYESDSRSSRRHSRSYRKSDTWSY